MRVLQLAVASAVALVAHGMYIPGVPQNAFQTGDQVSQGNDGSSVCSFAVFLACLRSHHSVHSSDHRHTICLCIGMSSEESFLRGMTAPDVLDSSRVPLHVPAGQPQGQRPHLIADTAVS